MPDSFRKLNLTFKADGHIIKKISFDYGASFTLADYPEIPQKDGYYAEWSTPVLDQLHTDTVVNVEYTPYIPSLSSSVTRENGRPVFFVDGFFGGSNAVQVTQQDITADVHGVTEQWLLEFTDDGNETHQIRYLTPGRAKGKVYVKQADGSWHKVETGSFGSYTTFTTTGTEVEVAFVPAKLPIWAFCAGGAALLVLLLLRCGADEPQPGSAAADETAGETTAETQPVPATQAADPPSKDDPLLLLVSRAQPLAEDYAPELTQLHDWPYSIAAIAYEPLRQMLAAGRAEGLSFTVASAYRSTDSQRQLFDEDVEARVSEGMTEDPSVQPSALRAAPPGCSEHETGLAVDIVATDNQRLDDTQEQTPETIWLHENCWRFGFILRYPAGKEDVTGIDYESWHYRYVGIEAARYLTEQQLTLDEFWAS